MRVLDWNGHDIPDELRKLPAGRYLLEPLEEVDELTLAEEEGIREALASLETGAGVPDRTVRERVDALLKR